MDSVDSRVFTVYSWFQNEMKRNGRNIKFPNCRDVTKTYQFRWTKNFVLKCEQWGLDDKVIRILIEDIVKYAKKKSLLDRGTQILCMGNIIDICYNSLKELSDDEASLIQEIESCHNFLIEELGDKDIRVLKLIELNDSGCSNLLHWYNVGYITEAYMALSKSCNQAIAKLPNEERLELPSNFELFRLCTHIVSDELLPKLIKIMGSDLRVPPTALLK